MESGKKSLGEKVSEQITKLIIENHWDVGDRLPSEYELAKMLGVGRSTVREAIRALVSRNVLEVRRGAGTFISQKCGVADDPLGLAFIRDKFKLAQDLMEIRVMIEPQIAEIAATKAEQADIEVLRAACTETEGKILAGQPHMDADIRFHTAIASCSKNIVMPNLIPIISRSIEVFIGLTVKTLLQETVETHREIVSAITEHDAHRAHDAMLLHLVYNRKTIDDLIRRSGKGMGPLLPLDRQDFEN